MKLALFKLLIFSFSMAGAHEGAHGPTQKTAPHGGILRDGDSFMMELVQKAGAVKLHALDHHGAAIDPKEIAIDAKASQLTDPKKKSVPTQFVVKGDSVSVDFKNTGAHRYELKVVASYKGKNNTFKWQVEPQGD